MRRNLITVLAVIAAFGLASSAWAADYKSDGGGGESSVFCICEDSIGPSQTVGPLCTGPNTACGTGATCVTDDDCRVCVGGANAGDPCPVGSECDAGGGGVCTSFDACVDTDPECGAGTAECTPILAACTPGDCVVASGPFTVQCPLSNAVPALSQWGLILFGAILLTAMFVIRRRRLPRNVTALLLVLATAGLIAVGGSYAEIQSNRACGETDVAVDFVNDILNLKG